MSTYQNRVDSEAQLAINEARPVNYLQPTEAEIGDFLETGRYFGKCKKCNVYGEAEKIEGKYRCMKCHA